MLAYLEELGLTWEGHTAAAARAIKRHIGEDKIQSDIQVKACVQLAIKLSKSNDLTEERESLFCEDATRADVSLVEKQLSCLVFDSVNEDTEVSTRPLSAGVYAQVSRGLWQNEQVAIKKFHTTIKHDIPYQVIREVAVLRSLNHENVIRLLSWRVGCENTALVLPIYDGTLHELQIHHPLFDYDDAALQLLSAVAHCHSHHILHRDIKPDNILVRVTPDDIVFVLCDFNLARFFDGERAYTQNVVTPWYRLPELTMNSKVVKYGTGVDDWALGCVFFEMAYGRVAFSTMVSKLDKIHAHFFNPISNCICKGCRMHRKMISLQGSLTTVDMCIYKLLKPSAERTTVVQLKQEFFG